MVVYRKREWNAGILFIRGDGDVCSYICFLLLLDWVEEASKWLSIKSIVRRRVRIVILSPNLRSLIKIYVIALHGKYTANLPNFIIKPIPRCNYKTEVHSATGTLTQRSAIYHLECVIKHRGEDTAKMPAWVVRRSRQWKKQKNARIILSTLI